MILSRYKHLSLIAFVYLFLRKISKFLPKRKIILFESNPDFSCNTYPVYKEIKKRRFFKNYKLIWLVSQYPKKRRNCILKNPQTQYDIIRLDCYTVDAECLISCNAIIKKRREEQIALFLSHGSKTKKTKGICSIGEDADYVLCQSHFFDDIITYEYDLRKEQLVYLGYPRCDIFYDYENDVYKKIGIGESSRYIIWLPTFRTNSAYSNYDTNSDYNKIGMPLIYSVKDLQNLNDFLKEKDIYIIFKPHPAQDVSTLKANTMSNILVVDDGWLRAKKLRLYDVIAKSSALITDYSSVFFDYILLDKPIATTTDDIEMWKNNRGFAFDLESMYDKATIRVPNLEELKEFIVSVNENIDTKKKDRNEICKLTNIYQDGNSAKRVVDFIEEKLRCKK